MGIVSGSLAVWLVLFPAAAPPSVVARPIAVVGTVVDTVIGTVIIAIVVSTVVFAVSVALPFSATRGILLATGELPFVLAGILALAFIFTATPALAITRAVSVTFAALGLPIVVILVVVGRGSARVVFGVAARIVVVSVEGGRTHSPKV